jgi:hypothetical protein
MTDTSTQHLTADELDALIGGIGAPRALSHTATCAVCRELVILDRQVVALLGSLPAIDAPAGFEDRVMARITIGAQAPALAPIRSPREVAARRRVLGLTMAGSSAVAAGFVWAAADPSAAHGWSGAALSGLADSLWLSVQTVVANTAEQPWFGAVRDTVATPVRALPYLLGAAGAYALALAGLGRLLAEPATDAGW